MSLAVAACFATDADTKTTNKRGLNLGYGAAPAYGYAAGGYAAGYSAGYAAPLGYAAPALGYASPALGYAAAAPAYGYAAPAIAKVRIFDIIYSFF